MQYIVRVSRATAPGVLLRFCVETIPASQTASDGAILLAGGRVAVWDEPDDDPMVVHVTLPDVGKQTLSALGRLLVALTDSYGSVSLTLED